MRLLLDTHIFMWWAEKPARLTPSALLALEDEANELVLSVDEHLGDADQKPDRQA